MSLCRLGCLKSRSEAEPSLKVHHSSSNMHQTQARHFQLVDNSFQAWKSILCSPGISCRWLLVSTTRVEEEKQMWLLTASKTETIVQVRTWTPLRTMTSSPDVSIVNTHLKNSQNTSTRFMAEMVSVTTRTKTFKFSYTPVHYGDLHLTAL